jgi:ABC-type transport system substrate-binding protein
MFSSYRSIFYYRSIGELPIGEFEVGWIFLLEPRNITDGNSVIAIDQIYNRLTDFKPGTVELEPSLATEWSSYQDGKTCTFKLRSGVKFHLNPKSLFNIRLQQVINTRPCKTER